MLFLHPKRTRRPQCFLILAFLWGLPGLGDGRTLASELSTGGREPFQAEAYVGQPFGVGVLEMPAGCDDLGPTELLSLRVRDRARRVFYPAVEFPKGYVVLDTARQILGRSDRPVAQLAAGLLSQLPRIRLYFLFRGGEPLELTVSGPVEAAVVIRPRADGRKWARHLAEWWEAFRDWDRPIAPGLPEEPLLREFMPYLECMLADRLGLKYAPLDNQQSEEWAKWLREYGNLFSRPTVGSFLRMAWGERAGFRPKDAIVDLPVPRQGTTVTEVAQPEEVAVEPIAHRVPKVCCYIRFGNYQNFVWFQDFIGRLGGDWEHLFRLRRWRSSVSAQIEQALALRQTVLSRTFGPLVVDDVALVLGDFAFEDGGTFGILFRAHNDAVLSADLLRQRAEVLASDPTVTETSVEISGRKVSLLSSKDGSVRSFYVAEGGYHFVTRSRKLAELFLATADPTHSLAGSVYFRKLRRLMPPQKDDTVFAYIGPEFWTRFFGPAVQIERFRRHQALADIRLVKLARLAAAAEGADNSSLAALVGGGFLPADFGPRADGSEAVLNGGDVLDSKRGKAGAFVPIWDLPPERVTPRELSVYAGLSAQAADISWIRCPIGLAVSRQIGLPADSQRESLTFRLCIIDETHRLGLAKRESGEDFDWGIVPPPRDGFFVEYAWEGEHKFVGVREIRLPQRLGGRVVGVLPLRDIFVGYWGEVLSRPLSPGQTEDRELPRDLGASKVRPSPAPAVPAIPPRISRGPLGAWELQTGSFAARSFHREVLEELAGNWRLEMLPEPTQARVFIADLTGRPAEAGFKWLAWARAVGVNANHVRFLHGLEEQFRLEFGSGKAAGKEILGAELACPFGGDYVWKEGLWQSSKLPAERTGRRTSWLEEVPRGFHAPPLDWFRGAAAEVVAKGDTIWISARVGMEVAHRAP
ncbi:MAG: hypothetical protein NZ899_10655 [Thermoguttaceae bacterium]|nr:hypothetical protein [Thermoguttaceae bacterium]MDW8078928.1 hypothetical protein [Thermoguttaceae bacterium]